jgi:glycosyltransferase involved in cell wall biosynthesis
MSAFIRLRQQLARLKPARVRRELRKWHRRLARVDERIVTLEPEGEAKGDVLVSYILDALLLREGEPIPHSHTNFWESLQIARTFVDLGYRVDVVSWTNLRFSPRKPYRAVVDVRLNLERWAPVLPRACVKILHIESAHGSFNNAAQLKRLRELEERRGIRLRPRRLVDPNHAIESADCATSLGNEFTHDTYRFAGKPIYPIPISSPVTYPQLERSIEDCRRRFLWFGSGGLVHKGLDLVLDAFADMPEYHLTVCGAIQQEQDFERAYYRELYRLPNIHTHGWIDVASREFLDLCGRTLALIYPSCSEGGGGGVLTCMQAGLIPIVSRETSVPIDDRYGILLADCRVSTLQAAVRRVAALDAASAREMSTNARAYAREHHTRERFAAEYRKAAEEILRTPVDRGAPAG